MLLLKSLLVSYGLLKQVTAIWPLPLHYSNGSKMLWLSPEFKTVYKPLPSMQTWENLQKYLLCVACTILETITLLIVHRPWSHSFPSAVHDLSALNAAVERMRENVFSQFFVPWKFFAKDQVFEPNLKEDRTYITTISLEQIRSSTTTSSDESYTLTVSEDGHVIITFSHPLGGIRALVRYPFGVNVSLVVPFSES